MMYKEFYFSGNSMPAVVAIKMCGVDFTDDNYLNSSTRCIMLCFFFVVVQLILIEMDQIKNISYKSALSFLNLELE